MFNTIDHELKFKRKALGVSRVVNKIPSDEIFLSLLRYKNKDQDFGGLKKVVMQNSLNDLTEFEIQVLSKAISGDKIYK